IKCVKLTCEHVTCFAHVSCMNLEYKHVNTTCGKPHRSIAYEELMNGAAGVLMGARGCAGTCGLKRRGHTCCSWSLESFI
uniref:Uncharacterized protein n=1 Tax=Kryptolebias marmoratus TaxID=37003 RepID=A0A3Q3B0L5_KRYMA